VEHHPQPAEGLMACEKVIFTPHLGGSTADPSNVFRAPLEVIVAVAQMHRPKWIVNEDVVSK
jgi:phosphoglycerate dehydrogenase-like enzyme